MNRKLRTVVPFLLILVLCAGTFAACSTVSEDKYATTVVATLGDENIYLDEANYYAKREQYLEESYYLYLMGTTEIWSYDIGDGIHTVEDSTKETVMSAIYQTHLLCQMADEYGVSLSEADEEKVQESVDAFYEVMPEETLELMGAEEDVVEKVYTMNALANRVWEYMVQDIDTDVDYEENRQITVSYILFAPVEEESEETEEEEAEDETAYEETEEYAAMEELAVSIVQDLVEGVTMSDEVDLLQEDGTITASTSEETFGRDDYSNAYGTIAWSLATGEYGTAYVEGAGWYVIYCETDDDTEATESVIESILDSRRDERFTEKYADLVENGPEFEVDEDVWALVTFDTPIYDESLFEEEEEEEEEETE